MKSQSPIIDYFKCDACKFITTDKKTIRQHCKQHINDRGLNQMGKRNWDALGTYYTTFYRTV